MEVCIAYRHGRAVMLALREGIVYIDDEPQPIKGLEEEELKAFSAAVSAIPYSVDEGYAALVNARRASFLVSLLGRAVGDECINRLTELLEGVHSEVLTYLGEYEDA